MGDRRKASTVRDSVFALKLPGSRDGHARSQVELAHAWHARGLGGVVSQQSPVRAHMLLIGCVAGFGDASLSSSVNMIPPPPSSCSCASLCVRYSWYTRMDVTKCGTVSRVVWGQGMEAVLGLHGLPWLSLSRQLAHVDSGGYCTTASNPLCPATLSCGGCATCCMNNAVFVFITSLANQT